MGGLFEFGWLPILVASACSATIMIIGGLLTEIGPWYRNLAKPSWQPPDWAFAPVWTVIYILVTLATVMAWNNTVSTVQALLLCTAFVLNGMLNVGWSLVFFKWRRPDWAFLEEITLWLSTVMLALVYAMILPVAGYLIVPYIIWVTIAGYLNYTIVALNRPFAESANFEATRLTNNA